MSLHNSSTYARDLIPVLDDAYKHMNAMAAAAEYHSYRCPERNARAERAAVRYEQLKRDAQRLKIRSIEVVPVQEAV